MDKTIIKLLNESGLCTFVECSLNNDGKIDIKLEYDSEYIDDSPLDMVFFDFFDEPIGSALFDIMEEEKIIYDVLIPSRLMFGEKFASHILEQIVVAHKTMDASSQELRERAFSVFQSKKESFELKAAVAPTKNNEGSLGL